MNTIKKITCEDSMIIYRNDDTYSSSYLYILVVNDKIIQQLNYDKIEIMTQLDFFQVVARYIYSMT